MSADVTPSRLSASAKIALFEQSTQRRRRPCQQTMTGPYSSPSFQRPTQSSASRAAFTVISPNASAVKHPSRPSRPTNMGAWCNPHESVALVVSPCQQAVSTPHPKGTKKRLNGAVRNANPTTVVTPQKESLLTKSSHRQLGLLLSPTATSKNTPNQCTVDMTPAPLSTPSPASRNKINRRIDYSVRKARVRDSDSADLEDLLELLRMKEEECQEKEEEKRTLTVRLKRIDQGLRDIERERTALFNKATRLETEKTHLKKELDNREREVKRLTKRCASEQKRVEESTSLRARNAQLATQLESLQKRHNQERTKAETVRQQLKECQEDRDRLLQRLKALETEIFCVKENLTVCVVQNEKLFDQKSAWEAEKQSLVQQAHLNLEQKLQSQLQLTTSLQNQLDFKDEKIRSLELLVQENDAESLVLHQRLSVLENNRNHEPPQTEDDMAQCIINQSQKDNENREMIQLLKGSLQNKALELESVRLALVETKNELEASKASLHAYDRLGSVGTFEELLHMQNQNKLKLPFEMEIRSARIRKLENALNDKDTAFNSLRESLSNVTRELESSRLQNKEDKRQLLQKFKALEEALGKQADAKAQMDKVCSDLQCCRTERDSLVEQLRCVEHNYSLIEATSKTLMEERCAWETERHDLVKISETKLGQQQANQIKLQKELNKREDTIRKLKGALREAEIAYSNMRNELEHAQDELGASKEEADCLRSSMKRLKQHIEDLRIEHLNVLSEKDAMIMVLGANVHNLLSRLMVLSSSQEQANENNQRFEALTSEIRSLQHENDSLTDLLQQSSVAMAELQAELLKEQIEKSLSTIYRSKGLGISSAVDLEADKEQEGIESRETKDDLAQLTKTVIGLEKERDELHIECQRLQGSMENVTNDRRGLLVSLEKPAASVEKSKALEKSTLEKLAICRQDLEAARHQIASQDEKIKLLDSELKVNCIANRSDNELISPQSPGHLLVDSDIQCKPFYAAKLTIKNYRRSSKLNEIMDSKNNYGNSKSIGSQVADAIICPLTFIPDNPGSLSTKVRPKKNIQTTDDSLVSDPSMNFVSMSMDDSSVEQDNGVELEQLLIGEK